MWESAVDLLDAGRIRRFQIRAQGEPLPYLDIMALWQSDEAFRAYCMCLLAEAPVRQKHALWQAVGKALERRLSRQPLWLSSAGLGVYWLHLRLDSRPKYYSFQPYRVQPKPALSQGG